MAPKSNTAVATTAPGAMPDWMRDQLESDAGQGLSKEQADNLVPLVNVLQKLSPQVEKNDDRYLAGAEAGDIWLRNAPQELIKGSEGMVVQPCHFVKAFVEWVPRDKGGGFVAQHSEPPEDAKEYTDKQNPNKKKYLRPNGNELIETRNHVVLVYNAGTEQPLPYVIPMTGSGHTVSRDWMSKMNRKGNAPAYSSLYKLTTRLRKNQLGSWFTWDIEDAGWASQEQYEAGKALHNAFASGQKDIEVDTKDNGNNEQEDEKPF